MYISLLEHEITIVSEDYRKEEHDKYTFLVL